MITNNDYDHDCPIENLQYRHIIRYTLEGTNDSIYRYVFYCSQCNEYFEYPCFNLPAEILNLVSNNDRQSMELTPRQLKQIDSPDKHTKRFTIED